MQVALTFTLVCGWAVTGRGFTSAISSGMNAGRRLFDEMVVLWIAIALTRSFGSFCVCSRWRCMCRAGAVREQDLECSLHIEPGICRSERYSSLLGRETHLDNLAQYMWWR